MHFWHIFATCEYKSHTHDTHTHTNLYRVHNLDSLLEDYQLATILNFVTSFIVAINVVFVFFFKPHTQLNYDPLFKYWKRKKLRKVRVRIQITVSIDFWACELSIINTIKLPHGFYLETAILRFFDDFLCVPLVVVLIFRTRN